MPLTLEIIQSTLKYSTFGCEIRCKSSKSLVSLFTLVLSLFSTVEKAENFYKFPITSLRCVPPMRCESSYRHLSTGRGYFYIYLKKYSFPRKQSARIGPLQFVGMIQTRLNYSHSRRSGLFDIVSGSSVT